MMITLISKKNSVLCLFIYSEYIYVRVWWWFYFWFLCLFWGGQHSLTWWWLSFLMSLNTIFEACSVWSVTHITKDDPYKWQISMSKKISLPRVQVLVPFHEFQNHHGALLSINRKINQMGLASSYSWNMNGYHAKWMTHMKTWRGSMMDSLFQEGKSPWGS